MLVNLCYRDESLGDITNSLTSRVTFKILLAHKKFYIGRIKYYERTMLDLDALESKHLSRIEEVYEFYKTCLRKVNAEIRKIIEIIDFNKNNDSNIDDIWYFINSSIVFQLSKDRRIIRATPLQRFTNSELS